MKLASCPSPPASCFVDSTWPKFIGDGENGLNRVTSLDRCSKSGSSNEGRLVVAIETKDTVNLNTWLSSTVSKDKG